MEGFTLWLARQVGTRASRGLGQAWRDEREARFLQALARDAMQDALHELLEIGRDDTEALAAGLLELLGDEGTVPLDGVVAAPLVERMNHGLVQAFGRLDEVAVPDGQLTQSAAMGLEPVELAQRFLAALYRRLEVASPTSASARDLLHVVSASRSELADRITHEALRTLLAQGRPGDEAGGAVGTAGAVGPGLPSSGRPPAGGVDDDEHSVAALAVVTLVLEQLPTGGWTRSLASWMERYSVASGSPAPLRPAMRVHGGIDITCVAIRRAVNLSGSGSTLGPALGPVVQGGLDFLRQRTGVRGAVGATVPTRSEPTEVRIRHTAVAMSTRLLALEGRGGGDDDTVAIRSSRYLQESLPFWRLDTSGTFGVLAASSDLYQTLRRVAGGLVRSSTADPLLESLATALDEMAVEVLGGRAGEREGRPTEVGLELFGAYGGLTAMQTSGFLLSAGVLLAQRRPGSPHSEAMDELFYQVDQAIEALAAVVVDDVDGGLLTIPTPEGRQPDLGVSAQLLGVVAQTLTRRGTVGSGALHPDLEAARDALRSGIADTVGGPPEVLAAALRFTNGVQLGSVLDDDALQRSVVADPDLAELLGSIVGATLSERGLTRVLEAATGDRSERRPGSDVAGILAGLLEAGYYVEEQALASEQDGSVPWEPSAALRSAVDAEVASTRARGGVVRLVDRRAEGDGAPATLVVLSTSTTSGSAAVFQADVEAAAALLAPTGAILVPVRFGDHRLVTSLGAGVLFVADAEAVDALVRPVGLTLVAQTITGRGVGTEALVRLGPVVGR